jgi:hypothetical protein
VKREFQLLTDEGTLVFGVVEGARGEVEALLSSLRLSPREWDWDAGRARAMVAPWALERLAPRIPLPKAIVEEYPTWDRLEVERTPL